MRPLIFEFKESPENNSIAELAILRYSEELNLNVDVLTGLPAIGNPLMITETGTKADDGEQSDTDKSSFTSILITETGTLNDNEDSDTDHDRSLFSSLLETHTGTRKDFEISDKD